MHRLDFSYARAGITIGRINAPLGNCPVGRLAGRIASDICRYRSSAGRRHHRLVWVIRRFGDVTAMWTGSASITELPLSTMPSRSLDHDSQSSGLQEGPNSSDRFDLVRRVFRIAFINLFATSCHLPTQRKIVGITKSVFILKSTD